MFPGSYSDDSGEIIQFYLDTNEQTVLSEVHLWHAILKKKFRTSEKCFGSIEAVQAGITSKNSSVAAHFMYSTSINSNTRAYILLLKSVK